MNILEIAVIGSRGSAKEKIFALLSKEPLRKFEGLDVGCLNLKDNYEIYFYFLNQEDENHYYLWDLIIPYAACCIVVCDVSNMDIFEKNLEVVANLEKKFATPIHICSLPVTGEQPDYIRERGQEFRNNREFIDFNPDDKKSAQNLLIRILPS